MGPPGTTDNSLEPTSESLPFPGHTEREARTCGVTLSPQLKGTYEISGWPGSVSSPEAPFADWAPGWPTSQCGP